jgi:hypothetical protein
MAQELVYSFLFSVLFCKAIFDGHGCIQGAFYNGIETHHDITKMKDMKRHRSREQ